MTRREASRGASLEVEGVHELEAPVALAGARGLEPQLKPVKVEVGAPAEALQRPAGVGSLVPGVARVSEDVQAQKEAHPEAIVLAHPECSAAVLDLADEVLSTTGILNSAKNSPAREFIIATEHGVLYSLRNDNPGKKFYFASKHALCTNMKKITLEKIMWALERMQPEVRVPEELRKKAWKAVDRMVAIG